MVKELDRRIVGLNPGLAKPVVQWVNTQISNVSLFSFICCVCLVSFFSIDGTTLGLIYYFGLTVLVEYVYN